MNEQLRLLIELQKIDSIILSGRMRIDLIPSAISSHEEPFKKAEAAYEAGKRNCAALEQKKKDRERDIEDLNEKIKKLKQRSSDIKNNKEYQAHLKEIERAERDVKSAEDDILAIMNSLEEAAQSLKAESVRIAEENSKLDEIKKDLGQEVAGHEEELKKRKKERKAIVEKIEEDVYGLYTSIMKSCRGLAVVEAKDEICQGCYLHIPPQLFVELRGNDEIVQCPQCRRILYYVSAEESALKSQ